MSHFIKVIIACLLVMTLFGCTKAPDNNSDVNNWTSYVIPYKNDVNLAFGHTESYKYFLGGQTYVYKFTSYSGLNDYLNTFPSWYACQGKCPTREQYVNIVISEPHSQKQIIKITNDFNKIDFSMDDKARAIVSMVQKIDYNTNKSELYESFPYQVLFDDQGICGEKSMLLILLLKNLGYRTAYIYFPDSNHAGVGIGCNGDYEFKNTGYCYIETINNFLITDIDKNFENSKFEIYHTSLGNDFNAFTDKEAIEKQKEYLKHIGDSDFNYIKFYNFDLYWGLNKKSCDVNTQLCMGLCWATCDNGNFVCDSNGASCR